MKRRLLLVAGILVLGATALWHFAFAPRFTQRLPPGWSWESTFIGISGIPDPKTGAFPERDLTTAYERAIRLVAEAERPRAVQLLDTYAIRDHQTGRKTWEYVYRGSADPASGARTEPEFRGDVFVFPRHVEKGTYSLRFSYLKAIPVAFEKEEAVEGLETYLFAYKGRGEYTESYQGSAEYPGVKVAPGQEIRCLDDQFVFRAWVEPVTGEIVKLDESCYSGDFVHDQKTGRLLQPVLKWGGVTTGDDVILRAERVRRARSGLLWAGRDGPVAGLLVSLLLLIAGAWRPARPAP